MSTFINPAMFLRKPIATDEITPVAPDPPAQTVDTMPWYLRGDMDDTLLNQVFSGKYPGLEATGSSTQPFNGPAPAEPSLADIRKGTINPLDPRATAAAGQKPPTKPTTSGANIKPTIAPGNFGPAGREFGGGFDELPPSAQAPGRAPLMFSNDPSKPLQAYDPEAGLSGRGSAGGFGASAVGSNATSAEWESKVANPSAFEAYNQIPEQMNRKLAESQMKQQQAVAALSPEAYADYVASQKRNQNNVDPMMVLAQLKNFADMRKQLYAGRGQVSPDEFNTRKEYLDKLVNDFLSGVSAVNGKALDYGKGQLGG